MPQARTLEEIKATIKSALDSVWVVDDSIAKLTAGNGDVEQLKSNIARNVEHLKHVTTQQDVIDSAEDISALITGIAVGDAKLAELA